MALLWNSGDVYVGFWLDLIQYKCSGRWEGNNTRWPMSLAWQMAFLSLRALKNQSWPKYLPKSSVRPGSCGKEIGSYWVYTEELLTIRCNRINRAPWRYEIEALEVSRSPHADSLCVQHPAGVPTSNNHRIVGLRVKTGCTRGQAGLILSCASKCKVTRRDEFSGTNAARDQCPVTCQVVSCDKASHWLLHHLLVV